MSDLLDKIQTGTVVRCASQKKKPTNGSVRKTDSVGEVDVSYKGARYDYHAMLEYSVAGRHDKDYFAEWGRWGSGTALQEKFLKAVDAGMIPIRKFNLSLVSDCTYNTLNLNSLDGIFGENITIANFDLNILRQDSFLKIGDKVVLQVVATKSLCRRGLEEVGKQQGLTANEALIKLFQRRKIGDPHTGIVCLTVQPGTIKIGDTVTNVISPAAGQPWTPVEESHSIDQKIKFVTPDQLNLIKTYKLYTGEQ